MSDQKTLCYSLDLRNCWHTGRSYKLTDQDGKQIYVPGQAYLGCETFEGRERHWIAKWALDRRREQGHTLNVQYNRVGWYNHRTHRVEIQKDTVAKSGRF